MLIVTGSDNNYVAGVLVLIASAAFHNPGVRFAVLDMGISPENRIRIDRLAEKLGVEIRRMEIDEAAAFATLKDVPVLRDHLNRSSCLRLLIPDLFPLEDRAIYMDCDMVVLDSLAELDRVPLADAVVAAVPCFCPNEKDVAATGQVVGEYINAGLLVMNLPVWRKEGLSEICIRFMADPEFERYCEDQSPINKIAKGRTVLLPARYNVYSVPDIYERPEDVPAQPAVVHYVVHNKPWLRPVAMERLWFAHAARIDEILPSKRLLTLRSRLSHFNGRRKLLMGVLLRRRKYVSRYRVQRHMDRGIVDVYMSRHGLPL